MATDFQKLPRKQFPKTELRTDSKENKQWKLFQFPVIVKEYSAINCVHFSPVEPYNCLVTSSAKVQIFAPYTNEIIRTSSRSKENVYGARFRLDGKLMVTGGESGTVQVLDVNSRAILRNLKGHTKPTHVCHFGREHMKVFSASDDKTVRCWDLPTEKETFVVKAHKDYIRSGCINPTSSDIFISGSYDHKIKMWDLRSPSVAMEMNHGAPIECVIFHQNGSLCISSGGNYINVWDIIAGGKLYHQFSNHQKTITSLCFNGDYTRLLSGSLDRHVKVYDIEDYSLVANIDYPSPILAMDISADSQHIVVGMSDGAISLRHKKKTLINEKVNRKRSYKVLPGTYLHRIRNRSAKPNKHDVIIRDTFTKKLSKADRHLQKFRYHEALDCVLVTGCDNTEYVISVLTELSRRNALKVALKNRDANSLLSIMKFLVRNISCPFYAKILVPIADLVLTMYSSIAGTNKKFDLMLKKLSARIKADLRTYEEMMKLLGAMEQVFTMITPHTVNTPHTTIMPNANEVASDQNVTDVDFVIE
ncbi:U3 small nucleolar RNA-associated protein 15 homolog isoform X1 [Hydra vulgaris]|uniref:U3 small nucleolar RNA-associated protein 15 homolog n=1 Tax=Hydra vulgaris TaxID=6087 RepID=T2M897_HYDVU|nr:U3 small nucleolar RNA-associated protein 15 homolog [Hydra vulgaris]